MRDGKLAPMTWRVLIPSGPAADVRTALKEWLAARGGPPLTDEQIRVDLIHSDDGELLRVMVDAELDDASGAP